MNPHNFKIIPAFLLGLVIPFFCNSQDNYLEGYIVQLNGDTLKGFIDYRNWDRNPEMINFRWNGVMQSTLSFTDIKSFTVADEKYISAVFDEEISSDDLDMLSHGPELKTKKISGFLQTIIDGPRSLYFYKSSLEKNLFYIKNGDEFQLLEYKRFFVESENVRKIRENKRYVGQLTIYFEDCPAMRDRINEADYTLRSIRDLFVTYYSCSGKGISFNKEVEKSILSLGAVAGLSVSHINFSSDIESYNYLTDTDYPYSFNFSGGLFFEIFPARNLRTISFYNEFLFTSASFETKYEDNNETCNVNIGLSYLKMSNLFRYTTHSDKDKFFVNLGITSAFLVHETNLLSSESDLSKAIPATTNLEVGVACGIGGKIKRFSLEMRGEVSTGLSGLVNLSSSMTRIYLLVGYKIF